MTDRLVVLEVSLLVLWPGPGEAGRRRRYCDLVGPRAGTFTGNELPSWHMRAGNCVYGALNMAP